MDRAAVLDPTGRHRLHLRRRWSDDPVATWVLLNPSTADADTDDPTLRRCLGFARRWGCGGVVVVNLWTLRATDPRDLVRALRDGVVDPPEADAHRAAALRTARDGLLVLGFGTAPGARERWRELAARHADDLADTALHCLGRTADGSPRHPLYAPYGPALPWQDR